MQELPEMTDVESARALEFAVFHLEQALRLIKSATGDYYWHQKRIDAVVQDLEDQSLYIMLNA